MKVRDAMTTDIQYISSDTNLEQAACEMRNQNTGFLPIGDSPRGRLKGVITDRDIVTRAVAEGKVPGKTQVDEVKTDNVLYCFEDDDIEIAARSMKDNETYRLVVLDNREDKMMSGVVTLSDISEQKPGCMVADTAAAIAS